MMFNIIIRAKLSFLVEFVGGGWERGTEPHNLLDREHPAGLYADKTLAICTLESSSYFLLLLQEERL